MYVVIDDRHSVAEGYVLGFSREGLASLAFRAREFVDWFDSLAEGDLEAIQGVMVGEAEERLGLPSVVRGRSRAPVIALEEHRSLEQTLHMFAAGADDIVRKPVHIREIVARCTAIWRRINAADGAATFGRLTVFFDNRDPQIDGEPLCLPRRERQILEYLIKNRKRRISKTQLFNAIYGLFNDQVDETVIEGHVSKLRKKLRQRLGFDVIDAKRFAGYSFVAEEDQPERDEDAQVSVAPQIASADRPHLKLIRSSPAG